MQRGSKVAFAVLVMLVWEPMAAQEPLRVEVVASTHHQWERIPVRISNLTTRKLQLVLPMYRSTLASDPLDVERKNGRHWTEIRLAFAGPRPRASPQIQSGETLEFKFGVLGAGEYRVRVWYVASPQTLGPPPHPARYASVVSAPFQVD